MIADVSSWDLDFGTCIGPIPAFSSCTAHVTFTPQTNGAHPVNFEASANPGTTVPITQAITGTGQTTISVMPAGPSFDFGSTLVGVGVVQNFTITNDDAVNPTGVFGMPQKVGGVNPNDYSFTMNTCTGVALAANGMAGDDCVLQVTFSPMAVGPSSGGFRIEADPGGRIGMGLSGMGT